jgi:hypothetical protein
MENKTLNKQDSSSEFKSSVVNRIEVLTCMKTGCKIKHHKFMNAWEVGKRIEELNILVDDRGEYIYLVNGLYIELFYPNWDFFPQGMIFKPYIVETLIQKLEVATRLISWIRKDPEKILDRKHREIRKMAK